MPTREEMEIAGEKLKGMRNETGKSVHKVAKAVHISGNYLSEIERGLKEPSDKVLGEVADYYETGATEKDKLFSLYKRIVPSERLTLLEVPEFRKMVTNISTDSRLTEDEKEQLYLQFSEIYENLANKSKDKSGGVT